MNISQENLTSRLLYLPLDIHEKVLLWLAYKGLKPVSEITVERRGNIFALAKKGVHRESTYSYNSPNSRRIKKWIRDAKMYKAIDPKFNTSWHVSKNKDRATLSAKILRRLDYDNEYKSGIILGYPEESAKGYAQDRVAKKERDKIPMIWPEQKFNNSYLKDKYYTPYIFYAIREDRVVQDSQIAKTWADTVRKDIPTLAKWFEKQENSRP